MGAINTRLRFFGGDYLVKPSTRKLDYRQPSAEQIWSFLQRQIALEEPSARIVKQRELLSRQIIDSKLKTRLAAGQLSAAETEVLFREVYGVREGSLAATLINLNLAIEDLSRFGDIAFSSWLADYGDAGWKSLPHIACVEQLSKEQLRWLDRAGETVVDWHILAHNGPWSGDPRACFIAQCLQHFEKFQSLSMQAAIAESREAFSELYRAWRSELPGSFLPQCIVLVEGQTEAILLPHLSACLNLPFDQQGIFVIPAGGAKQVARRYLHLRNTIRLPMLIVLDSDAAEQAQILADSLRDCDRLHILSNGEIEDTFEAPFLVEAANRQLQVLRSAQPLNMSQLDSNLRRSQALDKLWRERGLGSFDKIGLARTIAERPVAPGQVPAEIKKIVESLRVIAG